MRNRERTEGEREKEGEGKNRERGLGREKETKRAIKVPVLYRIKQLNLIYCTVASLVTLSEQNSYFT